MTSSTTTTTMLTTNEKQRSLTQIEIVFKENRTNTKCFQCVMFRFRKTENDLERGVAREGLQTGDGTTQNQRVHVLGAFVAAGTNEVKKRNECEQRRKNSDVMTVSRFCAVRITVYSLTMLKATRVWG